MKYSIVYSSKTGNTAKLAEKIKETISPENIAYFGQPSPQGAEADTIFIGFWTDKGLCPDTLKPFIENLRNKNIILFGTAGFGGSQEYFNQIIDRVAALLPESCTLKSSFMCQGKMPLIIRDRYVQASEKDPSNAQMKLFIENFDLALSHPNEDDFNALTKWVSSIVK